MKTFSQSKQDFFIDCLFAKKRNGLFLDIGAHDGITLSNTYLFEKYRNWKGICIEPNPEVFEGLNINRSCININCCISDNNGYVVFRKVAPPLEMLSGIFDFFDEKHIKRIENEISRCCSSYEDITVKSENINQILNTNDISKIDYCSIDTEGAELNIIQSLDFNKFTISVFSVEKNNDKGIRHFLNAKGYICIKSMRDNFYVKKKSIRYWNILYAWMLVRVYQLSQNSYHIIHHAAHIIKMKIYRFLKIGK